MTEQKVCSGQRDSQCGGPNVGPCLAGTSTNKESSVAGAKKGMNILVVADVKMYGDGI